MSVLMSQSKKVLRHASVMDGDFHVFEQQDDDTGKASCVVILNPQDYADFGKPSVLTVTVVPEDTLNENLPEEPCGVRHNHPAHVWFDHAQVAKAPNVHSPEAIGSKRCPGVS